MWYKLLADFTIIIHLAFILFVVLGGLLVLRWKKMIWVHIPVALWGIIVEYFNVLCPLTPLENYFRVMAGKQIYTTDFIEQYLLPMIYPEALSLILQYILGSTVILINLIIYLLVLYKFGKNGKRVKTEQ
jgi:hypothetical protein